MVELIEDDENFILISLLVTVFMQMSFFAIAYTLQIDKVTDFAGTSNFLVLSDLIASKHARAVDIFVQ